MAAPVVKSMSSDQSFVQKPLHALCRSKMRAFTSPRLVSSQLRGPLTHSASDVGSTTTTISEDDGEEPAIATTAAPLQHKQVSSMKAKLTRKAQSFSEGVEPATAERLTDTDVFLGGSCNPTTWRRDIAIPILEEAQVKYFNPQVDEWFEELIQIESRAKETAKIVLIVIDNLTRSIVCIHEAVEHICRGRRVVLVVEDIQKGTVVEGSEISDAEMADLNGARECLRNLAIKQSIRLFDDVQSAIEGVITWLMEDSLSSQKPSVPRLRKRSSIILNEMSGHNRTRRAASRSCSSTSIIVVNDNASTASSPSHEDGGGPRSVPSSPISAQSIVKHLGCNMYGSYHGSVYLGGNLHPSSWREKVAIPRLTQAGIPFYIPLLDYVTFELNAMAGKSAGSYRDRWKDIEKEKARAEVNTLCALLIHGQSTHSGLVVFVADPVRYSQLLALHCCHDRSRGARGQQTGSAACHRTAGRRLRGRMRRAHRGARVQGPGARAVLSTGDGGAQRHRGLQLGPARCREHCRAARMIAFQC